MPVPVVPEDFLSFLLFVFFLLLLLPAIVECFFSRNCTFPIRFRLNVCVCVSQRLFLLLLKKRFEVYDDDGVFVPFEQYTELVFFSHARNKNPKKKLSNFCTPYVCDIAADFRLYSTLPMGRSVFYLFSFVLLLSRSKTNHGCCLFRSLLSVFALPSAFSHAMPATIGSGSGPVLPKMWKSDAAGVHAARA